MACSHFIFWGLIHRPARVIDAMSLCKRLTTQMESLHKSLTYEMRAFMAQHASRLLIEVCGVL